MPWGCDLDKTSDFEMALLVDELAMLLALKRSRE